MNRRLKHAAIIFIVVLAAAQLVRPERANPATDASHTIQAEAGTASGLVAVLDRSCRDCHSNGTVWPWYTQIAPVSWLMAYGVTAGRKAVNFSEWTSYRPQLRHAARPQPSLLRSGIGRQALRRETNKPRNESRRVSSSEAYRRCRRVAPQQQPPGWQSDLSPVEEERARCIRGESARADL